MNFRKMSFVVVAVTSCVVLLLVGGASGGAGSTAPAATAPPPQSLTLYATKDAYVTAANPSINYGSSGALYVGREAG